MQTKDINNYLLGLNIASVEYGINYSMTIEMKFNDKKMGWISYRKIHKWNTKDHIKLETHFCDDLVDLLQYITDEFEKLGKDINMYKGKITGLKKKKGRKPKNKNTDL